MDDPEKAQKKIRLLISRATKERADPRGRQTHGRLNRTSFFSGSGRYDCSLFPRPHDYDKR